MRWSGRSGYLLPEIGPVGPARRAAIWLTIDAMEIIDPIAARQLIDELGFLLVPGRPVERGRAYLIVGLRSAPTLAHFDPELIQLWRNVDGRGARAEIEWSSKEAPDADFSWGEVRIVDRLGVSNEFVTFGGRLEVARIDKVKVCVFSSDAPIVARGGHSQDWEYGAQEIVAFLGRLRAAADPRATLERQMADLSPVARYASFIWDRLLNAMRTEQAGFDRADRLLLLRERRRLTELSPTDWQAGVDLACALGDAPR